MVRLVAGVPGICERPEVSAFPGGCHLTEMSTGRREPRTLRHFTYSGSWFNVKNCSDLVSLDIQLWTSVSSHKTGSLEMRILLLSESPNRGKRGHGKRKCGRQSKSKRSKGEGQGTGNKLKNKISRGSEKVHKEMGCSQGADDEKSEGERACPSSSQGPL